VADLNTYLAAHFLTTKQLAAVCLLSEQQLLELVESRLIPRPSYVVSRSTVKSYVFGEMQAVGAIDGQYFHPASKVWVDAALRVLAEVGGQHASETLRVRFAQKLRDALAELNSTTWRLHDSFADDGSAIHEGLRLRIESVWEHFLQGTFGLCVANPISEAAIARKEVLQEKLSALSENGARATYTQTEANTLLELIDAYAKSAMPFSPIEYPVSSRKRLVEDLSARIASAQQGAQEGRPINSRAP
jgi:hypothetical protein